MRLWLLLITFAQDDAGQHFARGRELAGQGLYEEAIEEFEKADQIAESPAILIELAAAYEKVDRCQAAVNTWEKLAKTELSAEQREQIGERMAKQRFRLSHNECKDGPKRAIAAEPTRVGRGRRRERVREPEPEGSREHYAWGFGFRIGVVFGRVGTSETLAGTSGYDAVEDLAGLNLRLALQIPLARTANQAPILQLEPFFALSYYGFQSPVQLVSTGGMSLGTINGGDAMLPLLGAAARFSIPLSDRTSLAPSVGFGVGWQHIALDVNSCSVSTSLASPVMTFDLPLRIASEPHHAFYFTPASLYFIFPAGGDSSIDGNCFNMPGATASAKAFYKLDSAHLNYALDLGYMYQW